MNEKGSRWHLATPLSVCQSLHTDAACGLSRKAARSRFKKQGRNPLFDDVTQKKKSPIKSLLLDPALLLMLFSALLAILFLSPLKIVCTVVVLGLLMRKPKLKWLGDYALPISLVLGMISAIPITAIFG